MKALALTSWDRKLFKKIPSLCEIWETQQKAKMILHAKYKRSSPYYFGQEDFFKDFLLYKAILIRNPFFKTHIQHCEIWETQQRANFHAWGMILSILVEGH